MNRTSFREFDLHILSLLSEKPSHGYQLLELCDKQNLQLGQRPTASRIYYSLQKLQKMGLTRVITTSSEKAPDRLVHAITAAGRDFLSYQMNKHIAELKLRSLDLFESYKKVQEGLVRSHQLMHQHSSGSQCRI